MFKLFSFYDAADKNLLDSGGRLSNLKIKTIKKDKVSQTRRLNYRVFPRKKGYSRSLSLRVRQSLVIKTLQHVRLTSRSIEAVKLIVKKFLGRDTAFLLRIYPYSALAKRPKEVRMGRGKAAKIYDWNYPARATKIICEFQRCFDLLLLDYIISLDKYFLFENSLMRKFYFFNYKFSMNVRLIFLKL